MTTPNVQKTLATLSKYLLAATCIISLSCLFNLGYFYVRSEQHVKQHAAEETHKAALTVEKNLQEISSIINGIAGEASRRNVPDAEMREVLAKALKGQKALYGTLIAYAPFQYSGATRLHSIYAIAKDAAVEFTTVEKSYDYTDGTHAWYSKPIAGGAMWSKPFWGQASNAMVVTYSIPVFRTGADGTKRHLATVSAVCSLNSMNNIVASLDLGSSGYGFITTNDSTFVAHPAEKLVLDKVALVNYAKKNYRKKNQQIIERAFGRQAPFQYQEPTKVTKQMGVISMEPLKSVGWFVGTTLVKSEICFPKKDEKRQWLYLISAIAALVVVYVMFMMLNHDHEDRVKFLPIMATTVSIFFAFGLIAIWILEVRLGMPSPYEDKGFVADMGSLEKHIETSKLIGKEEHDQLPTYVRTGILLHSIKLTNLNETEISGVLWQKIPEVDGKPAVPEGVRFPSATSTTMDEAYRRQEGDAVVVGWNFTTTLPQDFDNTLYPFERQQIKLPLRSKNMMSRIQLVPDFGSYDVTVPTANPFVVKSLFIPGWYVKQNYFSFADNSYTTNFGLGNGNHSEQDLLLTITTQREFLTNVISVFLPFFMLAIIAFIALLMTSGMKSKVATFSCKPSNMLEVVATFLLFLVLSTISIRGKVISDKVLYVEYMFFFMYFVLFGLIVASAKIAQKEDKSLFGYQDGYIVKAMYWPIVLGSMFSITLAVFF